MEIKIICPEKEKLIKEINEITPLSGREILELSRLDAGNLADLKLCVLRGIDVNKSLLVLNAIMSIRIYSNCLDFKVESILEAIYGH